MSPRAIFTIGHSTRSLDEFLDLLRENRIERLADIRRFPASRRFPHFSGPALSSSLGEAGIEYRHFPGLGGRRKGRPDSPHTGWRVEGFRSYADHMDTPEFASSLAELESWASAGVTVILCAEATPFRCHRRLVSDALVRDGFSVRHILARGRVEEHTLTPFARIVEGRIVYDAGEDGGLFDERST